MENQIKKTCYFYQQPRKPVKTLHGVAATLYDGFGHDEDSARMLTTYCLFIPLVA